MPMPRFTIPRVAHCCTGSRFGPPGVTPFPGGQTPLALTVSRDFAVKCCVLGFGLPGVPGFSRGFGVEPGFGFGSGFTRAAGSCCCR
jgi:hypothetical protein